MFTCYIFVVSVYYLGWFLGLEIRGCQESRAPLNSPGAPSNFYREPKDVLVSIHNTLLR